MTNFDVDIFLRDYWQKRPLLIRNPWKQWNNPLEPEDLAGLACEEGIESRLINCASDKLVMESGPLAEDRFSQLGEHPWTLLVQAVNHHVPDVADLMEPFRFIPDWRIDDVMVSYATNGGGVGCHYDQYDVFLVQGLGKRRWRIGPVCDSQTPLLPHQDLRLIADFDASEEWVLEPGDILYLPPCFAHDGVAVSDDCMTYSIGFRASSRSELLESWAEHQADGMTEEDRYADPDLTAQNNPGEIAPAAIDRLHHMVMEALSDRDAFARWFGLYNSLPKYAETDWSLEESVDEDMVAAFLAEGMPLVRNPASRFSFIRRKDAGDGGISMFVDGVCHDIHGGAAILGEGICAAGQEVDLPDDMPAAEGIALITSLINQGALAFEGEEE